MELTILIVVLFLGVGIPLRNKRYKKWKKKREDKNGEGFKGDMIAFLDDYFNKAKGDRE